MSARESFWRALVVFSGPRTQARKILLFLCLDQGFAPAGPRWCVHAPTEYARRWEKGCFGIIGCAGLGRRVFRHRVAMEPEHPGTLPPWAAAAGAGMCGASPRAGQRK